MKRTRYPVKQPPMKLVRIDEKTWIEVSETIPDKTARDEYLVKLRQRRK